MNAKIIQKIQNLFKLAEDNNNPSEVENALLLAQRLMAKHGIEQGEIELAQNVKRTKEVVHHTAFETNRLTWYAKNLSTVIAENFRCEVYINHGYKTRLVFLGLKEDVELAKMVFNFAVKALEYGAKKYVKFYGESYGGRSYNAGLKNDYIRGWISGLRTKYAEQVKQNNWGLILVKDNMVIEAVKKMKLRKEPTSRITSGGDSHARNSGYKDGKNFNSPQGELNAGVR